MLKISKKSLSVLIIVLGVCVVFAVQAAKPKKKEVVDVPSPRSIGPSKAPIQITEFIDFQCPACAKGAIYLKKLRQEHPKAIRLQMKYFPLSMHKFGFISAEYAECAARQGKFWSFQDNLVERQSQWSNLLDVKSVFEIMAIESNVDLKTLRTCLEDKSVKEQVEKDQEEGKIFGVSSTPTYFINNKMVVGSKLLEDEMILLLKDEKK